MWKSNVETRPDLKIVCGGKQHIHWQTEPRTVYDWCWVLKVYTNRLQLNALNETSITDLALLLSKVQDPMTNLLHRDASLGTILIERYTFSE